MNLLPLFRYPAGEGFFIALAQFYGHFAAGNTRQK
jgi:hypothetical protein